MPIIFKNGKLYTSPFSDNQFNGNNQANGSPKIIDLSLVLPQALLGGEDPIKPHHWYDPNSNESRMTEEELREKVWNGWTLNYEQAVKRGKECKMQVVLSFQAGLEDPKQIKKHYQRSIEYHGEYVKCEFVKMIRIVEISLDKLNNNAGGTTNMESFIISTDKLVEKRVTSNGNGTGSFVSLEESLKLGEEWKVKGNLAGKNGKYEIAIRHYLQGLISIWPWTSSCSLMSFEQASKSGLIKLEQALLNNIITISLSHPAKSGIKKTTFENIARVTCELMLEIRYITFDNLRKCFERLAQLDEREYGIKGQESVNKIMADMFKDKKGNDDWAHKDCVRQHVCHE